MFAEIILNHDLSLLQGPFIYQVPPALFGRIKPGCAVKIPFRSRKLSGLVLKTIHRKPYFETKEIIELIYPEPILEKHQLDLAEWISQYYFCPLYKVIRLFLPQKIWAGKQKIKREKGKIKSFLKAPRKKLPFKTLTPAQKQIEKAILKSPKKHFLIRGITGSGKTEIYLHLTREYLKEGKQVLILVPEISLTPQLIDYFQKYLGDQITVIHSRLCEGERNHEWQRICEVEAKVVIGSRSALFSPFKNLGLIVLDEEHDWSYKQEQAPRYHARTVALKMSELLKIKVVMGSATPSLESFYLAQKGKYQLFELKERIGTRKKPVKSEEELPQVTIVDLREEIKKGNLGIFSNLLKERLAATLAQKEQAILFLNRRGAASSLVCRECGYVAKCPNCEIALTYHKMRGGLGTETLICHHCGFKQTPPVNCPHCKSFYLKFLGIGTQRVQEEIQKIFPLARVLRADRDTTSAKLGFADIYRQFKEEGADILVGTQMIGKGLDFPKVNLVGVILADLGLHIPDFRSSERIFQLLTQVAGRAGRREKQGEVVIQTYTPENFSLRSAARHDYLSFFQEELKNREALNYPPFAKLIKLTYTDPREKNCISKVEKEEQLLKNLIEKENLKISITSAPTLIPRLAGKYHYHIFIKGQNPYQLLEKINFKEKDFRIDVDPLICC